jgi:hypothetical protein
VRFFEIIREKFLPDAQGNFAACAGKIWRLRREFLSVAQPHFHLIQKNRTTSVAMGCSSCMKPYETSLRRHYIFNAVRNS